ncbi:serine hydrolase [Streptomyces sp. SS1-1]|uniref:serine hydrolase n=2 Tax=Streptomyces TaxID=1883 RepID=UPI00298F583E|nr:serine hydrolase [Streptomyces sp. SS1-1]
MPGPARLAPEAVQHRPALPASARARRARTAGTDQDRSHVTAFRGPGCGLGSHRRPGRRRLTLRQPETANTGAGMDVESRIDAFVSTHPSRAVVVQSLRGSPVCVQRHASRVFPAASLMKVPLAITTLEQLDAEQTVSRSDLGTTAYPSLLEVFDEQHTFTLRELCCLMLSTSDNPIGSYLTDRVGMTAVTQTAHRIGAVETCMRVGFTDDELAAPARQSTTTAADMSLILEYTASQPHLQTMVRAMRNSMRNFRLPLRLPDELPVAHKTGSLRGLAHDAGILYGRDRDVVAVFLTDDQSDTAHVGMEIGDCIADVWRLLGEAV